MLPRLETWGWLMAAPSDNLQVFEVVHGATRVDGVSSGAHEESLVVFPRLLAASSEATL